MASITASTFDPLRRFVNVRLQQGVPIVDSDWNELDDVRKFELRAFLKWFVGDGVPAGNDGFRVVPAGTDNDVIIQAGAPAPASGTDHQTIALRHVGRALVDGLDVIIDQDLTFSGQDLLKGKPGSDAKASQLGVPVIEPLTTPAADGSVLIYLDVWEYLITPDAQPSLVLTGLGVESCARVRREWVIRSRALPAVPAPADPDYKPGHAYLPLAVLNRRKNVAAVTATDIIDRRERSLLLPPSSLLADTLGVDPESYRRGEGRPPISLREAVNALLSGELPSTPELAVSPATGVDVARRAFVLSGGSLVAVWQSPRVNSTAQIVAARLDVADVHAGFSSAQVITSGTTHQAPSTVAVPGGDVVVTYQTGALGATTTDVVMRRSAFSGLTAAPEVPVFNTVGTADERPYAVVVDNLVVFFCYTRSTGAWVYRRYRYTDGTFLDAIPQNLFNAAAPTVEPHMAASPGGRSVWVTFVDNGTVRVLSFQAVDGGIDSQKAFPLPDPQHATGNPFVLPRGPDEATLFWQEPGTADSAAGIYSAECTANTWGDKSPVPGQGDSDASATLDGDGRTWLFANATVAGNVTDIFLRTRNPITGEWSESRRVVSGRGADQFAYPVFVSGQGIWLLWMSNRGGDFDLFAKRIVTAL
jgi:Family of unknown function (DUF6519)